MPLYNITPYRKQVLEALKSSNNHYNTKTITHPKVQEMRFNWSMQ